MKKVFAILMLAATLAACTREELPQVVEQPETPTTYTLSVKADRGVDTRALALDDKTLNAIWDGSEKVYVFRNGQQIGVLTPDLSTLVYPEKVSCTLSGPFTSVPANGDELTLYLNSNNYSGQKGTLKYIADYCDYAVSTLNVTGVNDGQIESTQGRAAFENQQAIVKFTLKDKSGNTISPDGLIVTDGTSTVELTDIPAATYTTNGAGVLYVAFPAAGTAKAFILTATVDQDTYTYVKSSATLAVGKYYSIAVKMTLNTNIYDLGDRTIYDANGLFTAHDGNVLIGTFPDEGQNVRIADGSTVTLRGVTLHNNDVHYAGVALDGSATIILEDDNVISGGSHHAGISLNGSGSTLTIVGTGTLDVTGGYGDAGIGSYEAESGDNISCGAIIIGSGTITAKGGTAGAGIGCGGALPGGNASCVSITINGGTVTATGGDGAAGIGCGGALLPETPGTYSGNITNTCGTITINGGTVTAKGGSGAAGIGSGSGKIVGTGTYTGEITNTCGTITISDGTVTVEGGNHAAGIGCGDAVNGDSNTCGDIIISGGDVTAKGGDSYAAGIGCGYSASGASVSCGTITISDGTVSATGGYYGAGIGCGYAESGASNSCGGIIISGGDVTAKTENGAAGIGCSNAVSGTSVSCGAITISEPAKVSSTMAWNADYSIGPSRGGGYCVSVTIYGEVYWDQDGLHNENLKTSPLVIPIP